jgi:hypothetical protein
LRKRWSQSRNFGIALAVDTEALEKRGLDRKTERYSPPRIDGIP